MAISEKLLLKINKMIDKQESRAKEEEKQSLLKLQQAIEELVSEGSVNKELENSEANDKEKEVKVDVKTESEPADNLEITEKVVDDAKVRAQEEIEEKQEEKIVKDTSLIQEDNGTSKTKGDGKVENINKL